MTIPRLYFLLLGFILIFTPKIFAQEDEDFCIQKMDKSTEKQFKKAREFQKNGKKKEALEIYNELLDENPEWLDVNYFVGLSYYLPIEIADFQFENEKNVKAAIEAFKRMYNVCPHYKIQANLYGARLAYLTEDFATATQFAKVLVENPDLVKKTEWIEEAKMIIKKSEFYDKLLNNPVPFEPHPVEGISTEADEYLATLSPDAEYFYFTRRQRVKSQDYFSETYTDKEYFSYSKKNKNGHFGSGEPLPYPFNQDDNEGSPAINLSNDYLVFAKVTFIPLKTGKNTRTTTCTTQNTGMKNGQSRKA